LAALTQEKYNFTMTVLNDKGKEIIVPDGYTAYVPQL
jgi:hypothetical protein